MKRTTIKTINKPVMPPTFQRLRIIAASSDDKRRNIMLLSKTPALTIEQPDIEKAIQLLNDNGMSEAAKHLQDSCQSIDALQQSIELMEQLKSQLKDAVTQLDNQGMLIKDQSEQIGLLQEQIARNERSVLTRIGERTDALRHGLANVKNGLIQSASDLVMEFRIRGKEALVGVRELFHVEGKLTWMKNCVDNGIYEMSKAVDKQERLMNEYQRAADAIASANHTAGKDTSFTQKAMEAMRNHHTVRCSIYEKMIATLEKMENHLNKAIEHNHSAIEEVREANKDELELA